MNKIDAKDTIEKLAERFDYHVEGYKKGSFNETQTRTDYINPLFEALGWDINNKAGLAESYREVIHEDKIKISGSTKAPDYCFTIYGQKKFFLEAKKPSVLIKESIDPAYQLRRYGWSAKMPISIISDFEEFSIYDCTIKPAPTDKASVSRIKYITYKDYVKEFDFLWETFSKEMVLKGSFDKFVSSNKGKKGTTGVDAEFLKSLDSWRDLLARNIVNRNQGITEDELNYSLQKVIDRIIFLRICEDRGIELENNLFNTIGNNSYQKLKLLFHSADQKYNSGLFDYKKDKITDNLIIDDKILKNIIEEMYYPKSPYEFSVIPVEILGHSYEQYLGKVIRITPGHRIKIEEKPEVRKAGGVYYTPQYIVDYIVRNTLGKLIGDGRSGLGDGNSGFEVGGSEIEKVNNFVNIDEGVEDGGNQELSGFERVEGIGRADNTDLYHKQNLPERGDVRADFTNEESSSISPIEHSGGEHKILEEGIHSSSINSNRLVGGIGNTAHNITESELHNRRFSNATTEKNTENRGNARSINQFSEKNSQSPNSYSQAPNPEPLTPNSKPLTPADVAKIKICDPACGSGSFLLGAYQYLLDWHLNYYTNADIKKKDKFLNPDGNLTTQVKKEILLNNIYGVDIDSNAVEVTKLSLMLKAMEGETEASISQLSFLHERVLPTLDNNIKSGNSLIDIDFYDNQLDFEPGAEKKIKPFNWQSAFPEVFGSSGFEVRGSEKGTNPQHQAPNPKGGFDVVIGNPPYYLVEDKIQKSYFQNKYKTLHFKINLFTCFTEFGFKILSNSGYFSFIIPNLIFANNSLTKLRELFLKSSSILQLINLGDGIFEKVSMPTMIYVCKKELQEMNVIDVCHGFDLVNKSQVEQKVFLSNFNYVFDTSSSASMALRKRLEANCITVEDVLNVNQGIITGNDKKYLHTEQINLNFKKTIRGKDIGRYLTNHPVLFVDYDKSNLACPRTEDLFDVKEKLLMRRTGDYPIVSYDDSGSYNLHTLYSCRNKSNYHIFCLLGMLNSKLLRYIYSEYLGTEKGRTFAEIKIVYIRKLPIPQNPSPETQNQLVKLVENMLQLNKDLQAATLPEQKEHLQARIKYTDKKIDQLVYQLYELSDDEIKIIEGE